MDYYDFTIEEYSLTLWQKVRLFFIPMQYSVDWTDWNSATVISFKIMDGKIIILNEE